MNISTARAAIARLASLTGILAIFASWSAANAQPAGKYECWYFTSPRAGLNFALLEGGRYTDVEGKSGTVTIAGANMTFHGAGLDGTRARYKGGNPPSVSVLGPRGDEVSLCQLAR